MKLSRLLSSRLRTCMFDQEIPCFTLALILLATRCEEECTGYGRLSRIWVETAAKSLIGHMADHVE